MMDLEWLYSALPSVYYNITVLLSVLTCEEPPSLSAAIKDEKDVNPNLTPSPQDQETRGSLFETVLNLFSGTEVTTDEPVVIEDSHNYCSSTYNIGGSQSVTSVQLYIGVLIAVTLFVIYVTRLLLKRNTTKTAKLSTGETKCEDVNFTADDTDKLESSPSDDSDENDVQSSSRHDSSNSDQKKVSSPLLMSIPKLSSQSVKNTQHTPSMEELFDSTVGHFLKELDRSLGAEMSSAADGSAGGSSLPVSSSSNLASTLMSPQMARRGLRRSPHSAQSLPASAAGQKQIDEATSKCWILYENFRKQLGWMFPDTNLDCVNFGQVSRGNDNLARILQFLHQNCPIRPRQWNAATCIVDYSLFILEQELKALPDTDDKLKFCRFEGIGSAYNGTLIGAADRFDILMVMDFSGFSEVSVLHSTFFEGIPSGHVILGVKDNGTSKLNTKCHRKACIQGMFGFYLLPHQIEDLAEVSIKKAVARLNRDHKSKTDRLPFKFQMAANKKLVLTFDTRLLQGLGLGIGEISVKFIPAISLSLPQFAMLPSLYAIPPRTCDQKHSPDTNPASSSLLGRIFRDQGHADLLWSICTEKVQTSVTQTYENRFLLSGIRTYHKECLMVLKALFSQGNKNKLLNKGEIDAYILYSVVSFLLQESPPSAWTLDCIGDRVSDAVHFLKSAFQNVWLPNFVIHNPHLMAQMPSLEAMSSLLSGRQQNMLSDVTNDAAMKVLDYIDVRLQETGLSKCVKSEFSPNMWEYEFFMFG